MLMEVKELHRSEKSIVTLVIDPDTGIRYVRKELKSSHPVYQQLQSLQHHYLPKIVQLEQNQGGSVLLEEYIDGANLAAITLPEKQTVTLMEELCEVLVFLHQHGIIHRDIKPSNLLLAPDGHIRLIDFDAAREEKPVGDSDTRLLGTKGYAPPEQYGFAQTDARADIYSVGVTMKQLLGKQAEKRPYRHIPVGNPGSV
ncbi:serine/threonine protein kinase [Pseudoflavonifractor phocaeensis]|uniref:serine/threonine protein kinase n=1 Tax=Pseudoflavonifractor phocaeensis TaxID=1870988 RepID=UPI001F374196|nr:protein kinase [Pseudoflavonifractor phocaeensis]MCF2660765.1 protein kinase [Pseudoflavonifractor phocaeensis]